jgi:hypothetical protein
MPNPKLKLREQFHEATCYKHLSLRASAAVSHFWTCVHFLDSTPKRQIARPRTPGARIVLFKKALFFVFAPLLPTSEANFLTRKQPFLIRKTGFLTSNAPFLIRKTSFLTSKQEFLIRNSSFLIRNAAFLTSKTKFLIRKRSFLTRKTNFPYKKIHFPYKKIRFSYKKNLRGPCRVSQNQTCRLGRMRSLE